MKLDFKKFLNENGLKIGDRIRLKNNTNLVYKITIDVVYDFIYLENVETKSVKDIQHLKFDFEKVDSKKTIGDLICNDIGCRNCPLFCITCSGTEGSTRRERFEATLKKYSQLEPMRAYLEQELDKEIEE